MKKSRTKTEGGYVIYIRTSTVKQGTEGVSLEVQEQEARNLAIQKQLVVREVVAEMETAAKRGRPLFTRVIRDLVGGRAEGLILHKIDRGARNLRDWSDITDLIERGIKVYIVHDSVDLYSRGGRLAGDMLAAVAADYIRNLREETRKGIMGRLKQGLWPFKAPVGYVNRGRGQAKTVDPIYGALVKEAFELYATGEYNFNTMRQRLHSLGLRTAAGRQLSKNGLTQLFTNEFYVGVLHHRRSGERFPGVHTPLVEPSLFARVQDVLHGRAQKKEKKHGFVFRRDIACSACGYKLTGERQKGHVYYRCHSPQCRGTSVREDYVASVLDSNLRLFVGFLEAYSALERVLRRRLEAARTMNGRTIAALEGKLTHLDVRESAVVDAVLDGTIDRQMFIDKKNALVREKLHVREQIARYQAGETPGEGNVLVYFELIKSLRGKAFLESPAVAREMVRAATSNFVATHKTVELSWSFPFNLAIEHARSLKTAPIPSQCWGTWTRTTINGARIRCPTIRRYPNVIWPFASKLLGQYGLHLTTKRPFCELSRFPYFPV